MTAPRRVAAISVVAMIANSALCAVQAAVFYGLGVGNSAGAVSPDGSLVLTNSHVWTPGGGLVPYSPDIGTYSRDISNNGVVVGLIDGSYIAFRTPVGGPLQELGALPGGTFGSDAFGITPDGNVVVGFASSSTGSQAFRWTSDSGIVGLGHLAEGDHHSDAANAVSSDGSIVVGRAQSAQGLEAFRWTEPTGMVGLGDLPGGTFNSSAQGISSNGQVIVGNSTSAAGIEAFRWTQSTGMVGLGDLAGGDFSSTAHATNADGSIVVGESRTTLIESDAFIWTAAHGMRNLQEVLIAEHGLGPSLDGWRLFGAADISDDGRVIVGYGRGPSGSFEGFVVVIPEPSACVLGCAGIFVFALTSRRSSMVVEREKNTQGQLR